RRLKIRSRVSLRVTITSMVESASCASATPGAAARCIEEEGGDAPSARAGPCDEEVALGVPAAAAIGPAPASPAAMREAGGSVMPPCSTDQPTTAQAPDCRQKAAETWRRSHESGFRVRWSVSAIDYTWFYSVGQTHRTGARTLRSMYVKCRRRLTGYVTAGRCCVARPVSRE